MWNKRQILLIISLAALLIGVISPLLAETRPLPTETTEQVDTVDKPKLENAKKLSSWVQDTLNTDKTLVALIARKGGEDVKKHDKTGMAHSGLAIYDPRAQTWIIYNLVNTEKGANPKSTLYRTALIDFFYGQSGYETEALVMIPDKPTQDRIYEGFLSGKYQKLFFTDKYNLLSLYNSSSSLNCNKWLLMNIVAARIDDYDIPDVLAMINKGFSPGYIRLSSIELIFAKKKTNVRANEINTKNIPTVTIESLYRSNLFERKYLYSGKTL